MILRHRNQIHIIQKVIKPLSVNLCYKGPHLLEGSRMLGRLLVQDLKDGLAWCRVQLGLDAPLSIDQVLYYQNDPDATRRNGVVQRSGGCSIISDGVSIDVATNIKHFLVLTGTRDATGVEGRTADERWEDEGGEDGIAEAARRLVLLLHDIAESRGHVDGQVRCAHGIGRLNGQIGGEQVAKPSIRLLFPLDVRDLTRHDPVDEGVRGARRWPILEALHGQDGHAGPFHAIGAPS